MLLWCFVPLHKANAGERGKTPHKIQDYLTFPATCNTVFPCKTLSCIVGCYTRQLLSCDLQRNAGKSIARQVADYMLHMATPFFAVTLRKVENCSHNFFCNSQHSFSLQDSLRRRVLDVQFHPQLVSQPLSSWLRYKLQEKNTSLTPLRFF